MSPHLRPATFATVAFVLCVTGCRVAKNDATDMDALLRTVSYDTSVPQASPSVLAAAKTQYPAADAKTSFAEKAGSIRQAVSDGLKTTAGVLLYGVFKLVKSALRFDDDDDDDDCSPRGRADQRFNQWLDDRDRWRRDG